MAGYSGTPLVRKLGIKENHRLAVIGPPSDFGRTLGDLPPGVIVETSWLGQDPFDVIVFFAGSRSQLVKTFATLAKHLKPAGGMWISWPKKTSGVATDLSENDVREVGLKAGLVDNKVCAVDDTWSGLRFVYRLQDRPPRKTR
jgi:hypothetical protein